MTEEDMYFAAQYPYDLAECGFCLLMHKWGCCKDSRHVEMSRMVKESIPHGGIGTEKREVYTNLRELFRDFYPQQPAEAAVEQPELVKADAD